MEPIVTKDWISDDAAYYSRKLKKIAKRVDGAEPTDGSVSGKEYYDARDFINTIEDTADVLFEAHVNVVDEEEIQKPTPFQSYMVAHEKLTDLAYRDIPNVNGRWRGEFEDARTDLQAVLINFPKP